MPPSPTPITPLEFGILELATGTYTATVTSNDGATPIPAASLLTLTLTLYVIKTDGTIGYVNSRNAQNVLNANNVTVDVNGFLTWAIQTLDTTLVEALPFERHIALWEWTATGVAGKHEMVLVVQALTEVP